MVTRERESAESFVPMRRTLKSLRVAASECQGCELYRRATQTVFGQGAATARAMLIGEQPGDQEDRAGKPFVGPAGKVLAAAAEEAGLDRHDLYLTNAVKHFCWEPRGQRRLHKKPPARAISACRPWLKAEVEAIKPEVVICLGATAAQAIIGRSAKIRTQRGQVLTSDLCDQALITWHPSAVLRAPDAKDRERIRGELVADLAIAVKLLSFQ